MTFVANFMTGDGTCIPLFFQKVLVPPHYLASGEACVYKERKRECLHCNA
jgi:hypothetical protein